MKRSYKYTPPGDRTGQERWAYVYILASDIWRRSTDAEVEEVVKEQASRFGLNASETAGAIEYGLWVRDTLC